MDAPADLPSNSLSPAHQWERHHRIRHYTSTAVALCEVGIANTHAALTSTAELLSQGCSHSEADRALSAAEAHMARTLAALRTAQKLLAAQQQLRAQSAHIQQHQHCQQQPQPVAASPHSPGQSASFTKVAGATPAWPLCQQQGLSRQHLLPAAACQPEQQQQPPSRVPWVPPVLQATTWMDDDGEEEVVSAWRPVSMQQ